MVAGQGWSGCVSKKVLVHRQGRGNIGCFLVCYIPLGVINSMGVHCVSTEINDLSLVGKPSSEDVVSNPTKSLNSSLGLPHSNGGGGLRKFCGHASRGGGGGLVEGIY